jgi:hypothetical protein
VTGYIKFISLGSQALTCLNEEKSKSWHVKWPTYRYRQVQPRWRWATEKQEKTYWETAFSQLPIQFLSLFSTRRNKIPWPTCITKDQGERTKFLTFWPWGTSEQSRTFGETVKQSCHFMKIDSQMKYVFKTRLHEFKDKQTQSSSMVRL